MCYSQGAIGRFNPIGAALGDNYRKIDPLMAASERHADRALTRSMDPNRGLRASQRANDERTARINYNNSLLAGPPNRPAPTGARVMTAAPVPGSLFGG